jgi:hypothetical protein
MKCWGVRERVCVVELLIDTGSATETQHWFRHEMNQLEAPSPNAVHLWVRQWCEEGSVVCNKPTDRPSSLHTPKNIAWVLASDGRSPRWSMIKHAQALRMSDRYVWRILHTDLNLHTYKLQILHSLGDWDKQVSLQLVIIFKQYWLKFQTCWTTFSWTMRHIFICVAQLISQTIDTAQLQILMNFASVPFMTQNLLCGVLYGPEESLDPTTLRMKMD